MSNRKLWDNFYMAMRKDYDSAIIRIKELECEVEQLKNELAKAKSSRAGRGRRSAYNEDLASKIWNAHTYQHKSYKQIKEEFELKICVATIRKMIVQYTRDVFIPEKINMRLGCFRKGGLGDNEVKIRKELRLVERILRHPNAYALTAEEKMCLEVIRDHAEAELNRLYEEWKEKWERKYCA